MRSNKPLFPRKRMAAVALAALALTVSACGSGSSGDNADQGGQNGGQNGGQAGQVDTTGVLRYADDLTAVGNVTLDPSTSNSVGDYLELHLIYDTLLRPNADGTVSPGLASDYKIVDSKTINLTIRDGLTFQDGTPLDADAVKFGLERNRDAKNKNLAPALQDLQQVQVTGDHTLTLKLDKPIAGEFVDVLSGRESMIVSPKAAKDPSIDLNTHPVGAGPYELKTYQSERLISLRKFDKGWDADQWKLAGIDFVNVADGPSRVNALLAGQVDMIPISDVPSYQGLAGKANIERKSVTSDSFFLYFGYCKSSPPFDNLKVRQALNYAVDRDAINKSLLDGLGSEMHQMWPKGSRLHDPSLEDAYAYDPDKAKKLLAESGHDSLTFDAMYPASLTALQRLGEVLKGEFAKVGVTMNLVPSENIVADFYQGHKAPAVVSLWIRPGLQKVTRMFGPNSVANICDYSSDKLDSLTSQIASLPPDDAKVVDLWHQIDQFIDDNALVNYVVFEPILHAWNGEKVAGVTDVFPKDQGVKFKTVYIKK